MFWLVVILILIIAEASTVNLVSIWFIGSGSISLILSLFVDNFLLQFGVFVLLGLLLLVTTRPIISKFMRFRRENTNLDRVIGMVAKVTEDITKDEIGEVKVDGKKWSAISKDNLLIGDEAVVTKIDGVKLVVRKKEE